MDINPEKFSKEHVKFLYEEYEHASRLLRTGRKEEWKKFVKESKAYSEFFHKLYKLPIGETKVYIFVQKEYRYILTIAHSNEPYEFKGKTYDRSTTHSFSREAILMSNYGDAIVKVINQN